MLDGLRRSAKAVYTAVTRAEECCVVAASARAFESVTAGMTDEDSALLHACAVKLAHLKRTYADVLN